MTAPHLVGVELGGTKCIAVLAEGRTIVARRDLPTGTDPAATLDTLAGWVADWQARAPIAGIGIGSFGPLGGEAGRFTRTGATPKPGWADVQLAAPFARFGVPILIDTDVAGAALAEHRWGDVAGADVLIYLTIGTGIGGGLLVDGRPLHGAPHPEMGHIRVRRLAGDTFPGTCPFHGDCLEGLASGPAIAARAGAPGATLGRDHPAWTFCADALAEAFATLILAVAPRHILIGGGVGLGPAFPLAAIRAATLDKLGGYVDGLDAATVADRIRLASLGAEAGPLGSIALAWTAADSVSA